jgi:hypothetical protein
VNELRPYYRQISEVMCPPGTGADYSDSNGGDASPPLWNSSDPGSAHPGDAMQGLDAASFGSLDLGAFDASAFDALDAGMASFDAGFDASVGDVGGGDGGGDGGGGGGGGGLTARVCPRGAHIRQAPQNLPWCGTAGNTKTRPPFPRRHGAKSAPLRALPHLRLDLFGSPPAHRTG